MPVWFVRNSCSQDSILSEDERCSSDFPSLGRGWQDLYLTHPDSQTRLLPCTRKVDLEWTQLNFLGFTSVWNLVFVIPLVSIHQFMFHEIENVKIYLLFGIYWIIWFDFVGSEVHQLSPINSQQFHNSKA